METAAVGAEETEDVLLLRLHDVKAGQVAAGVVLHLRFHEEGERREERIALLENGVSLRHCVPLSSPCSAMRVLYHERGVNARKKKKREELLLPSLQEDHHGHVFGCATSCSYSPFFSGADWRTRSERSTTVLYHGTCPLARKKRGARYAKRAYGLSAGHAALLTLRDAGIRAVSMRVRDAVRGALEEAQRGAHGPGGGIFRKAPRVACHVAVEYHGPDVFTCSRAL